MRLTFMTDYALRLLMYVGQHPDRLCTIAEIAQAHRVSEAHLTKITHQLGLQGWIETIRGKGGGMRLARPASDINLGEVVRGLEPTLDFVECFTTGSQCVLTGRCHLASVLQDGFRMFFDHMGGYTLADILPGTTRPKAAKRRMQPRHRKV